MNNKLKSNTIFLQCAFTLLGLILCNSISTVKNLLYFHTININILNLNLVISFIILLIIFLLYTYKKNISKSILRLTYIIVFIYNILGNVSNNFNPIGFLLLYLFLMLITYTFMLKTNFNFEISIISSVTSLILIFVIIGLLDLLKISVFIITLLCIFCIYIVIKNKEKLKVDIEEILNYKGFKIFSILYVIAIVGGIGRYIHIWDEYSYWAYAAKVVINSDSIKMLSTYTRNYPPLSSIWHYIVNIFCGYSEPNLYIGLCILEYIYIMPVFINVKNKKWWHIILLALVALGLPMALDGAISYSLLYVDLLLAMLCTSALILQEYLKQEKKSLLPVYGILVAITLLKPSGFIYSGTLLLLFYLKDIFVNNFNKKLIIKELKKYILPGIIIVATYFLWILYYSITKNEDVGYFVTLVPDSLKTDLGPKFEMSFLISFCTKVIKSFDDTVLYSFINIPVSCFLIIIFSIICLVNRKKEEGIVKTIFPYIISYFVFFGLTALSLFVMFSYYEASILASFSRYLAPIHVMYILYILYRLTYFGIEKKCCLVGLLFITMLISFSDLTWFLTDIEERKNTSNISNERVEIFSTITDNTEENSKVFVINQTDDESIMPIWYARYYCYPRIINANSFAITWKIKTKSNEWDLGDWGLTDETFSKHIIEHNFDYIFLYSSTEELFEELSYYFEDVEKCKNYKLFKVEEIEDSIKLIPIK